MDNVHLTKKSYGKNPYSNVVDIQFKELVDQTTLNEPLPFTVSDFFDQYQKLFFEIPLQGDINSHEYLVKKSGEYLGETFQTDQVQALVDEINDLRKQLLDANQSILDLTFK